VVVDDVEDLEVGAVGDGDVGDVGLPALVGQVGFEADVTALGALVGLGGHEPARLEHAPNRGGRRCLAVPVREVEPDGLSASVQPCVEQLFAHRDDGVLVTVRDPGGAVVGAP
jgi:hypothetical protein